MAKVFLDQHGQAPDGFWYDHGGQSGSACRRLADDSLYDFDYDPTAVVHVGFLCIASTTPLQELLTLAYGTNLPMPEVGDDPAAVTNVPHI